LLFDRDVLVGGNVTEIVRYLQLGLDLEERPASLEEKLQILLLGTPAFALGDIARNGNGCPSQLVR
jgi:hypothetical protein